jgi:hypothetical protein
MWGGLVSQENDLDEDADRRLQHAIMMAPTNWHVSGKASLEEGSFLKPEA